MNNFYTSEYTVFETHPAYRFLPVFISKIFFIKSRSVIQNREQFSEVYDLIEDPHFAKFDFITVPLYEKVEDSKISSELKVSSSLDVEEFSKFENYISRRLNGPNKKNRTQKQFFKYLKELFNIDDIDYGGLVWFEPYIHGFKVKFISEKDILLKKDSFDLKKSISTSCDLELILHKFNPYQLKFSMRINFKKYKMQEKLFTLEPSNIKSNIENEKLKDSDIIADYIKRIEAYREAEQADIKKETDLEKLNFIFEYSTRDFKKDFQRKFDKQKYKLEIRENSDDNNHKIYIPTIDKEVKLYPVAKSLYFTSLVTNKQINFKEMYLFEKEMLVFYKKLSKAESDLQKTVKGICNNLPGLSTQRSRINKQITNVISSKYDSNLATAMIKDLTYFRKSKDLIIDVEKNKILNLEILSEFFNKKQNPPLSQLGYY